MASTVADIIAQAFNDLGVTQPGDAISTNIQSAAFLVFQQMVASLSQEPLMVRIASYTFQPVAGTSTYTCGPNAGPFTLGALSPAPLMAGPTWRSRSGTMQNGGKVLSFAEFEAQVKDGLGTSSVIAQYVAAGQGNGLTSPNNADMPIRLWPTPATSPGLLDLDLLLPLSAFAAVTDVLNGFSPGWEAMLHYNLAVALAPQYARVSGVPPELVANASNSKSVIAALAASILGYSQQAPPQG